MGEDRVIERVTRGGGPGPASRALDSPDARVVDLRTEEACRVTSSVVAAAGAVQIGAEQELTHACARRERFELANPARHALVVMTDGAYPVENPAMDPLVRMSDTGAARAPIREPGKRLRASSSRCLDQTEPSASDALPAQVGDLAGDAEGVLEGLGGRIDPFFAQIDQSEQHLRKGSDREPLFFFDELERLLESFAGLMIA